MKALKKRVYSIPNLITKNLGVSAPRFLIMLVSLFSTIQPFVNVITYHIYYDGIIPFNQIISFQFIRKESSDTGVWYILTGKYLLYVLTENKVRMYNFNA